MILPIPSRQLVIVFWLFPLLVSSTTTGTTTSGPKEGSAASRLTTGGAEGAGAPCLIDADCSTGLSCYCPDRQFQQEGTGADSDAAADAAADTSFGPMSKKAIWMLQLVLIPTIAAVSVTGGDAYAATATAAILPLSLLASSILAAAEQEDTISSGISSTGNDLCYCAPTNPADADSSGPIDSDMDQQTANDADASAVDDLDLSSSAQSLYIICETAPQTLHSGVWGGACNNAASEALAILSDLASANVGDRYEYYNGRGTIIGSILPYRAAVRVQFDDVTSSSISALEDIASNYKGCLATSDPPAEDNFEAVSDPGDDFEDIEDFEDFEEDGSRFRVRTLNEFALCQELSDQLALTHAERDLDEILESLPPDDCVKEILFALGSINSVSYESAKSSGTGIYNTANVASITGYVESLCTMFGGIFELIQTEEMPFPFYFCDFSAIRQEQCVDEETSSHVLAYNHLDTIELSLTQKDEEMVSILEEGTYDGLPRGDLFVGRGTCDDKGPLVSTFIGGMYARQSNPCLRISFIFELEEENGSPHLMFALDALDARYPELKEADSLVIVDGMWLDPSTPNLTVRMRSLIKFELRSQKTGSDGLVELSQALSSLQDGESGLVTSPSMDAYKGVDVTSDDIADGVSAGEIYVSNSTCLFRSDMLEERTKRIYYVPTIDPNLLTTESVWAEDENPGLSLYVTSRLVFGQRPDSASELLCSTVTKSVPGVSCTVPSAILAQWRGVFIKDPFYSPVSEDTKNRVADAFKYGFPRNNPLSFGMSGASEPAAGFFSVFLTNRNVIMIGLATELDGFHADIESYPMETAIDGVATLAALFSS